MKLFAPLLIGAPLTAAFAVFLPAHAQEIPTETTSSEIPEPVTFEHFIRAEGPRLMNGEEEFRYVSFNVPTLLYVEDEMAFDQTNPYGLPNEFELRDLFESVRQMGGTVVRNYTIPVRHSGFPAESVTYVEAPGVFNEEAFRTMDLVIALAGEYGIRLVFPLVNDQEWMGGRPQYAAFRGMEPEDFWTDRQLIDDFKMTIDFVLNRVNTITGVPYRDDPTIMAWETGNELENPPEWALEISDYIKSIDPNHIVIDGYNAIHYMDANGGKRQFPREESINHPSIDMVNSHHYEPTGLEMIANMEETLDRVGGRMPVFFGEFGFIPTGGLEMVLDAVVANPDHPGILLWSLRRHHRDGGFYHHTEPFGRGLYRAYHYPGFDDGESYDERDVMDLMAHYGWAIRGDTRPATPVPAAPEFLPFEGSPMFSWRGSAGASGYDVERALAGSEEWQQVAYDVDDIETPGFALFSDVEAIDGEDYCYRVTARNRSGVSEPSAPVCLTVDYLTLTDRTRNLAGTYTHSGVSIAMGDNRSYKEAYSRIEGEEGAYLIYAVPPGGSLREFRLFAFEEDADANLTFSVSAEGTEFTPVAIETEAYVSVENNYDYLAPIRYSLIAEDDGAHADTRFIRVAFGGTANVVRVELDFDRP